MKLSYLVEDQKEFELFVDLDGVLANLQSRIEEMLGHELETLSNGNWAHDEEIWERIHDMGGVDFSTLDMMEDAQELWDYVEKYSPTILTAAGPVEASSGMKKEWVEKNLTGYSDIHTPEKSHEKAEWAKPHRILIDDRKKSTEPWTEAGGIAILHTSAKETIAKLKELGL